MLLLNVIMKHIKVLELSGADRLKFEKGYHNGPTHDHCIRCTSILLKLFGISDSEITEKFDVIVPTAYALIKRHKKWYQRLGYTFLLYIMDYSDGEAACKAIEEDRQSVSEACEVWEKVSDKKLATLPSNVF